MAQFPVEGEFFKWTLLLVAVNISNGIQIAPKYAIYPKVSILKLVQIAPFCTRILT